MAVNITWSLAPNGVAITDSNYASAESGSNTFEVTFYIRHNGAQKISGCALFIGPKTSGYAGDFNANSDYNEVIGWGDASAADDFGGLQINMDNEGGFSGGTTWGMSETQKTSTDGLKFTVRTGVGNDINNAVILSEKISAQVTTNGEIPTGIVSSAIRARVKVPANESVGGFREFSLYLKYSYTS